MSAYKIDPLYIDEITNDGVVIFSSDGETWYIQDDAYAKSKNLSEIEIDDSYEDEVD